MPRTISSHRTNWLIASIVLCLVCGCHWRDREECCPTDLKDTYGPFSSEAVRRAPCGPDVYNFGVKPTMWRCGPSDHPPSPAPCPDGCNWETQKNVPQSPLELAPMPSDNVEPPPPTTLPAPSFPMETQGAVPPIGQVRMAVPSMPPANMCRGGVQQVSGTRRIPCNIPVRQSCNRLVPQCRVAVPARY